MEPIIITHYCVGLAKGDGVFAWDVEGKSITIFFLYIQQ